MLLAKAVDALNDGFFVHLADDLALEAVLIRSDPFAEQHFEVAFGLAREVEAGSLHDSINGVHVMPDVAPSSAYLKGHCSTSEIAFERPRDHRVKGVPGAIADIHLEALFLCDDISPFEAVAAWVFQLWLPDAFALMD